jgi:hypothetical protein
MASPELQTPMAIDGCSLERPTTFCHSLIRRAINDMPSTVDKMRRAPSTLRANDDTRTRSVAEKSMTRIMASLHGLGHQD